MATTPPLHGLRIIECSALGPAAITTALVDLGRRRDQGRAARRRLHPRDDVAHRRGHLADAPAPQPGQALPGARPAHRRRRRHPEGAGHRRRRGRRGHAARGAGPARRRATTTCAALNPKIVFCSISGYGMTGPYRDYPSHGVAYDTWAGIVNVATDDEGFTYIPEHVSIGINAGPLFGALGILAAVIRARATGEGSYIDLAQSDAAAAMDWYRSRDLAGLRAARVRGDRQQGRQLRAPRAGHGRHGRGRALPGLRDRRRAPRPLHGVGAGVLEELLRGRRPRRTSSSAGPAPSTPTTPGATASSSASCATSSAPRRRRSGWSSAAGSTRRSRRSTRPRRCSTTRSSPTASRSCRRRTWERTSSSRRCTSSARSCRHPAKAPTVGQHTEAVLRSVLGYDDNQISTARDGGAFGTDA